MNILVIGLGFVGLTTALGFADKRNCVYGYDINAEYRERIGEGVIPFFEKGLPEALNRNLNTNFFLLDTPEKLERPVDAVFFCVGTPCMENGRANLEYLKTAITDVKERITEDSVLVVKSTVPPGTTKDEILPFVRGLGLSNPVAVNPEFLREGYCWSDFTEPDRIVCGVEPEDNRSRQVLTQIYQDFGAKVHFVTQNTAEFIKYLSNCLLANLVSFSNEMAEIANAAGDVSIGKAFKILHEDNRLQNAGIAHYIYPGCGYGGYCLPKDTVALCQNAKEHGYTPEMLRQTIKINQEMPRITAEKILSRVTEKSENIGIMGLSFKPNSDDVRDSSAAKIIQVLLAEGYKNIYVYDPVAADNFKKMYQLPVTYCTTQEQVCKECKVVAVVTVWKEFRDINRRYPEVDWVDCRYFL